MSERRPYWTDDLIEAVKAASTQYGQGTADSAFAVIAAVEDWQEREKTRCKSDTAYHCATHDTQWLDDESDRCEYKRMVDAEAEVAERNRRIEAALHVLDTSQTDIAAELERAVREALRGES